MKYANSEMLVSSRNQSVRQVTETSCSVAGIGPIHPLQTLKVAHLRHNDSVYFKEQINYKTVQED